MAVTVILPGERHFALESARRVGAIVTGYIDGVEALRHPIQRGEPVGIQHERGNYIAFDNDDDEHEGWYF
jgi:hypothetical protein